MRCTLSVLSLLLLIAACSADDDSSVLVLTSKNFDETVNAHETGMLVEFYAPWCGHCKALEPEYEKAAATLKEDGIPLAKVDATVETELGRRYDVSGYPTIKWFRKGIAYDYEGERTADGMVNFARQKADPNWEPPPDEVIVLSQNNFTDIAVATELLLVEFYAPWCGHCKKLAPQYSKAAATLKEQGSEVKLAKVDATEETELAQQYGVTGYPTLIMYRHGDRYEYKGPREHHGIVNYMMEQSSPPAMLVSSSKELDKMIKTTPDGMVVAFLQSDSGDAYNKLNNVANNGRDELFTFYYTMDEVLLNKYDRDTLVVFLPLVQVSRYDKLSVKLKGFLEESPDVLLEKIRGSLRPLVGVRSRTNSEKMYSQYPLLVAYLVFDLFEDGKQEFTYWRDKLLTVAKEYEGRVTVAMSNEEQYSNELEELSLDDWGEELAVAIWEAKNRRYAMRDEVTTETLQEFVEDYFAGKLQPVIKSQPVPKKDKGPITVVVGSNFDQIVNDPSKDVLIELYAPWCGHCKKLEPVYKQLAKKFKGNKKLVIAKMDATANDVGVGFDYTGFPTIYLSTAGGDKPILFEGSRDIEGMEKFLYDHATYSLGNLQKEEL